jgi:exonuclease-1
MGIVALLPQLRSITKRVHIEHYRGKTVAVDGYVLLHRGAYACARELVEGEPTENYITYCLNRVDLLLKHGVIPCIIFDGGPLPNKFDEETTRQRSREENRERAQTLWRQGNRVAALEAYQKAVDVTPEMAHCVILALKQRGVRFIVAPYEADAQMAYLALNGFVDAVITEDSDLLTYGCPVVLFKLDYGGEVDEISLADLPHCRELSFTGWSHDLFQQMCVMAGCDFLKGLPGIGIKKAHAHIRRTRDFMRALRALRFDGTQAPPGYEIKFQRALWTFKHQRVYCPRRREIVFLTEPRGGSLAAQASVPAAAELVDGEVDFLGPHLPVHIGQGIAEGRLHPVTHRPLTLLTLRNANVNRSTSIGVAFSLDHQLSSRNTNQQQVAMPPIAMSAEVRQQFKKPRMGPAESHAVANSQQLCKPKVRPLRSRVPAAALTAQQYFPSSGRNRNAADGSRKPSTTPLLTTLKASLQACEREEPEPGGEEAADVASDAQPEIQEPELGRLWGPARACWRTPDEPFRSNPPVGNLNSVLPRFSKDAGMHSPVPWDITPGFYAADPADPASAIAGSDVNGTESAAPSSHILGTERNSGRSEAISSEPLSLQFQEDDLKGSERGEATMVEEQRERPLVDLGYLPEAAIEAAAVTKSAIEAASEQAVLKNRKTALRVTTQEKKLQGAVSGGEGRHQTGSVFGKFACKK